MPTPDQQARLIEEVDELRREQAERFERSRAGRPASSEERRRYPALRFIAGFCQFLAIASFFLAVAGLAVVLFIEMPASIRVVTALSLAAAAVIVPVFLWGVGELLLLLVDMANDIRATRHEIWRLRRRRG